MIDIPRWLAARLGLHAYIDAQIKAALWERRHDLPIALDAPATGDKDEDDLPAFLAALQAKNRQFEQRNSGYVTAIHTQHALPAVHRPRRVIPARLWVERQQKH